MSLPGEPRTGPLPLPLDAVPLRNAGASPVGWWRAEGGRGGGGRGGRCGGHERLCCRRRGWQLAARHARHRVPSDQYGTVRKRGNRFSQGRVGRSYCRDNVPRGVQQMEADLPRTLLNPTVRQSAVLACHLVVQTCSLVNLPSYAPSCIAPPLPPACPPPERLQRPRCPARPGGG